MKKFIYKILVVLMVMTMIVPAGKVSADTNQPLLKIVRLNLRLLRNDIAREFDVVTKKKMMELKIYFLQLNLLSTSLMKWLE